MATGYDPIAGGARSGLQKRTATVIGASAATRSSRALPPPFLDDEFIQDGLYPAGGGQWTHLAGTPGVAAETGGRSRGVNAVLVIALCSQILLLLVIVVVLLTGVSEYGSKLNNGMEMATRLGSTMQSAQHWIVEEVGSLDLSPNTTDQALAYLHKVVQIIDAVHVVSQRLEETAPMGELLDLLHTLHVRLMAIDHVKLVNDISTLTDHLTTIVEQVERVGINIHLGT